MPDHADIQIGDQNPPSKIVAKTIVAFSAFRHINEGTMIESASMLDNGVISCYFHQYFDVDIFPHGHQEIACDDEDYATMCERFGLTKPGDRGVSLWRLINGEWILQCASGMLRQDDENREMSQ